MKSINKTNLSWLAILVTCALAAYRLDQQGRLWICACGRVLMWAGDIWSADNSQHLFDPYSFTHILHGFVFFWAAAWEVAENSEAIIQRYREATSVLVVTRPAR